MSKSNLVRVRIGGQETNVSRAWAEKRKLEILDEPTHRPDGTVRRPTRKGGRPLKPRVNLPSLAGPFAAAAESGQQPAGVVVKPYAEQTAEELSALVEARNDARGDEDLPVVVDEPGGVDELVAALELDDAIAAEVNDQQ